MRKLQITKPESHIRILTTIPTFKIRDALASGPLVQLFIRLLIFRLNSSGLLSMLIASGDALCSLFI